MFNLKDIVWNDIDSADDTACFGGEVYGTQDINVPGGPITQACFGGGGGGGIVQRLGCTYNSINSASNNLI